MSTPREQWTQDLIAFLRTIQKPNRSVDSVSATDSLVASGLIDSLAIVQIVLYLENTYDIDFSIRGLDPEQLSSISSIVDLIEETRP